MSVFRGDSVSDATSNGRLALKLDISSVTLGFHFAKFNADFTLHDVVLDNSDTLL